MQKLTIQRTFCRVVSGKEGSALVSAVGWSFIMMLAGVGYLTVSMTSSLNETLAMEHDKAFLAAESGLLYATRYARTLSSGEFLNQTGGGPSPVTVNGYSITMSITTNAATKHNTVTATASNPRLNFSRTVSWSCLSSFSIFSQLYNGYSGNASTGWWSTNTFIGPFHMNKCLRLMHPESGFYNFSGGLVSTANSDAVTGGFGNQGYTSNWRSMHGGQDPPPNAAGFLNDFDWGLQIYNNGSWYYPDNPAGSGHELANTWFNNGFISNQTAVSLPTNTNNDVLSGFYTTLPASSAPYSGTAEFKKIGPDSGNYRPTLLYKNNGFATYYYFNGSSYTSYEVDYRDQVIYATQDINVLGKVAGKTTLVTADNKSPVIVADSAGLPGIIYNSYDINTKTIGAGDSSIIGIVSGGNIAVNNKWMKQWSGNKYQTGKRVGMQDALAYAEGITSNKHLSLLHITAALVATEKDTSGMFVGGMGVNANGSPLSVTIPDTKYYCLYITGSVGFRAYRAHAKSSKGTYRNTYVSDSRLPHNVTYPNQPLLKDENGLLVLDMQDWADSVGVY